MPNTDALRRLLLPALIVLLTACWLGGGVTDDDTPIDEWLQLLSLPVLAIAVVVLAADGLQAHQRRWGLAAALLVFLLPALQLLPIPAGWWTVPPARQAIAVDLALAGIGEVAPRWTLSPFATERSLWSMLPALATFLAAIALPSQGRRRLVQTVAALALFNVVFAFFQAGLPHDSALRLYQDFDAGFGGLLANTNHQATACIIGMVLAIGLAMESRTRSGRGEARSHLHWWYAALGGFFLLMVPLSTARAGLVIALPAIASALLLTGGLRVSRIGRSKRATALAIGIIVLAIIAARAALGWMAVDEAEELRHAMASATVEIGKAEAPLGSGIGSFVPVFEQAAPAQLLLEQYVNHAHNEYAQWWLTAGWLGMLLLGVVFGILAMAGWQIIRTKHKGGGTAIAGACFVAIFAVLAHSWADYPLRTTMLMATTSALAGLMLAALADTRLRERSRRPIHGEDGDTKQPA